MNIFEPFLFQKRNFTVVFSDEFMEPKHIVLIFSFQNFVTLYTFMYRVNTDTIPNGRMNEKFQKNYDSMLLKTWTSTVLQRGVVADFQS